MILKSVEFCKRCFVFSDFDPVSLRCRVIILAIIGGIVFIILLTVLYCCVKHKKAQRVRGNADRSQTYQPSNNARRLSSSIEPSAPAEEPNRPPAYWSLSTEPDRRSLPPTYEESQLTEPSKQSMLT